MAYRGLCHLILASIAAQQSPFDVHVPKGGRQVPTLASPDTARSLSRPFAVVRVHIPAKLCHTGDGEAEGGE